MAKKNRIKATKSKAEPKKSTSSGGFKQLLSDQRTHRIGGLLILFLCIYCLIAFTSFIFTWKADQSMLSDSWYAVLREGNYDAENWLGPLGAMVGHLFIHNWFGVMSFLFILIFFNLGFKVLFKKNLLPPVKTFFVSILAMVIFSPLLAFVFRAENAQFVGGAFGYELNHTLYGVVGQIGTGILLFFAAIAFIIAVFNPSFSWLSKMATSVGLGFENMFTKVKNRATEARAAALEEDEKEDFQDTIGEMDDFKQSAADLAMSDDDFEAVEIVEKPKKKPAVADAELEMETTVAEAEPEVAAADDDSEFSVEMPKQEKELSEAELNQKVKDFGEYDPTLDLAQYRMPGVDLLQDYGGGKVTVSKEELEENKNKIVTTLSHYKIGIEKIKATIGPTVTLYEIIPEPGVRISKIKNLEDDIALSLAALGIRIIAPIPGRGTIGIEVPNSNPDIVSMRSLIASEKFQNSNMELPIALGKTINNESFVTDLAKMPHLLMAGATGQGKSVGLNAILVSLLYKKHPSQIKFVLVDPKKVELTLFNKIERHYLAKLPDEEEAIITDTKKVVKTLNSLCIEMDNRYEMLKNAGVRNIKEYNAKFIKRRLNPEKGHAYLPYIVLVVDEFADLIMTAGKEVETPIARLAQLARAIGIHLIIATQRPSVNIITGVIKANFPARIAFRVSSKIDSRTILDSGGADQLIGRGDMLLSTGNDLIRLQCGFVDTPEVDEITEFIGNQRAYPHAFDLPEVADEEGSGPGEIDLSDRDVLFEDAARVIVMNQQGSTSLIQRKLKLGYNRAGRIVDQLEAAGIVGPFEGSKARQVLVPDEYSLEQLLKAETENIEN
ncbi:DNA translocase FtsK [Cryomorpha ignava]|uniref:DNA translocase FtsK n=1 Tax=Cryomorpha ignava TaxID=101383 RepID=A0A7K3WWV8_9FLAO|nr:DNA translocase FtsK [Cryomorpha ignava]NEN25115.1 DNA translocase FtsK [Cryomorpha ignava]